LSDPRVHLKQTITLVPLIGIEVGQSIGAGVFALTGLALARTGPSLPLAFAAAAVLVSLAMEVLGMFPLFALTGARFLQVKLAMWVQAAMVGVLFLVSIPVVTAIYVAIAVVVAGVGPWTGAADEALTGVAASILSRPLFLFFVFGGGFLAVVTTLNATYLWGTRSLLLIAGDGLLSRRLAVGHRSRRAMRMKSRSPYSRHNASTSPGSPAATCSGTERVRARRNTGRFRTTIRPTNWYTLFFLWKPSMASLSAFTSPQMASAPTSFAHRSSLSHAPSMCRASTVRR
jgi:hypothetical protein